MKRIENVGIAPVSATTNETTKMARYANWRRPSGSYENNASDKLAPHALLAEIGRTAVLADDRHQISWQLWNFSDIVRAIHASVAIMESEDHELNESDSAKLISEAMYEVIRKQGGGKAIDPTALLECVRKNASKYFQQIPRTFEIATSLSINELPIPEIQSIGSTASGITRKDDKYKLPSSLLEDRHRGFLHQHLSATKYKLIGVTAKGRTANEAFSTAEFGLNVLRAVWTLQATLSDGPTYYGQPERHWIGRILVGPLYTVHPSNAMSTDDRYWFDGDYVHDAPIFFPKGGWEVLEKFRIFAFEQIETLPYGLQLAKLLARYAAALDSCNLDFSFLRLWSLLEKITDTVGANYDKTIERTLWIYDQPEIEMQLLRNLRQRRNQLVHSAMSPQHAMHACYLAKRFVDRHLNLLIGNGLQVSSLSEYAEYLSMPHSVKALSTKATKYRRALAFCNDDSACEGGSNI